MEALTIILLVLALVSVLFLLFMKYKVNKIKKKELEMGAVLEAVEPQEVGIAVLTLVLTLALIKK